MNCFFITPIGEEGSKTREAADDVFHGLVKPVCEKIGYNPIRADQLTSTASLEEFQRKLETFIQSNAANSENIRLGLDDVFSVRREPNGSISVNPRKL